MLKLTLEANLDFQNSSSFSAEPYQLFPFQIPSDIYLASICHTFDAYYMLMLIQSDKEEKA
jgi:hypothetical protein